MKEIKLSRGKIAVVDDIDFDFVSQWKWHLNKVRNGFYASAHIGKRRMLMHRLIAERAGLSIEKMIDHLNHDGLDNRRHNLRAATNSENLRNRGCNQQNTSGFKGVSLCKFTGRWDARITVDRKQYWLGRFLTSAEAAHAYDAAAKKLHREFAYLNFATAA